MKQKNSYQITLTDNETGTLDVSMKVLSGEGFNLTVALLDQDPKLLSAAQTALINAWVALTDNDGSEINDDAQ